MTEKVPSRRICGFCFEKQRWREMHVPRALLFPRQDPSPLDYWVLPCLCLFLSCFLPTLSSFKSKSKRENDGPCLIFCTVFAQCILAKSDSCFQGFALIAFVFASMLSPMPRPCKSHRGPGLATLSCNGLKQGPVAEKDVANSDAS